MEIERVRRRQLAATHSVEACHQRVTRQRQLDLVAAGKYTKRIWLVRPVQPARARGITVDLMLAALVILDNVSRGHFRFPKSRRRTLLQEAPTPTNLRDGRSLCVTSCRDVTDLAQVQVMHHCAFVASGRRLRASWRGIRRF
jgi:hypothetical protein